MIPVAPRPQASDKTWSRPSVRRGNIWHGLIHSILMLGFISTLTEQNIVSHNSVLET